MDVSLSTDRLRTERLTVAIETPGRKLKTIASKKGCYFFMVVTSSHLMCFSNLVTENVKMLHRPCEERGQTLLQ